MDVKQQRESATFQFLVGIVILSAAIGFRLGPAVGWGVFGIVNTAVGLAEYWAVTFRD